MIGHHCSPRTKRNYCFKQKINFYGQLTILKFVSCLFFTPMAKLLRLLLLTLTLPLQLWSQNTVGTILNSEEAYDGLSLFTVDRSTFLINNCGQVINSWESNYLSGKSVYVLPNGDLLRGEEIQNEDVPIPGIGGRLAIYSWDNQLKWAREFSSETITSHHDVYPLPNGNILVLIIEKMSANASKWSFFGNPILVYEI